MVYSRLSFLSVRQTLCLWKTFVRFSSTSRPIYYDAVSQHTDNIALVDRSSTYTYGQLYSLSHQLSRRLLPICKPTKSTDDSSTSPRRNVQLGVLCPNDASFVVAMWASWMVGATVVPLSSLHPPASLAYFLNDAQCQGVIVGDDHSNELIENIFTDNSQSKLPIINIEKHLSTAKVTNEDVTDDLMLSTSAMNRNEKSNALILYTSGTSGRPKGCVLTFDNVQAHVDSMVKAWQWTKNDGKSTLSSANRVSLSPLRLVILHVLPLHHVHGLMNALLTPLAVGATIIMLPGFQASKVIRSSILLLRDSLQFTFRHGSISFNQVSIDMWLCSLLCRRSIRNWSKTTRRNSLRALKHEISFGNNARRWYASWCAAQQLCPRAFIGDGTKSLAIVS